MSNFAGHLVGKSPAALAVRRFVELAAAVDSPVLLTGETGTGKTLVARLIHARGPRARAPFVAVNCAAVPATLFESEFFGHERGAFTGAHQSRQGFFEEADSGTLLLDEIGDLSSAQQAKLLTVLEDHVVRRVGGRGSIPVDARLISATAQDLEGRLQSGGFRRDLFHRVAVLRCPVPPLRERPDDILPIARHLLERLSHRHGSDGVRLSRAAAVYVREQPWPGNVRELAHVLEAGLVLAGGDPLEPRHLSAGAGNLFAPDQPRRKGSGRPSSRYSFFGSAAEEREAIRQALESSRGNKTAAARALGMSRNTLRARLRRFALETGESGSAPGG